MESAEWFTVARALHVLGVVFWIGGVAFVTTVLIPSLRRLDSAQQRMELFERLEGQFAFQAKLATVVTGAAGFYLVAVMDAWSRYLYWQFWWMHLMTFIWVIFTLVLFVLEPLFLHRWFHSLVLKDDSNAFFWLHRMHKILLSLSLLAVFGAVAGSHGLQF